jgi:tetratricopeptide (TPR) repeat protein
MPYSLRLFFCLALLPSFLLAQGDHTHGAPEELGEVSFPISCSPDVQDGFNRGVALLHSFEYPAARSEFQTIAARDPQCAMAHWGIAMTYFHELWEPPVPPGTRSAAQKEIIQAEQIDVGTGRERGLIHALALIFEDEYSVPYAERVLQYTRAMRDVASKNKNDVESQVFYALALLASASPADKTHANQKQAVELLEPLYRIYPQHPGIAHYLIHACDNAEMAKSGLPAARAYSHIAPSAPHALHMPSHIFTRLGLWNDSIRSNIASMQAAQQLGATGEELHAMDYLVYAYLQLGRDEEASRLIAQLKEMHDLNLSQFTTSYAYTAMPVRYFVERGDWSSAAEVVPLENAPPQVIAVAIWARGLGLARMGRADAARVEIGKLEGIEEQLRKDGQGYWATQVGIQIGEIEAWCAQDNHQRREAADLMRKAADEEDALEKLPVTPGPIIPAREQLGSLLLEQDQPSLALKAFQTALSNAPGRRGASLGAAQARHLAGSNSGGGLRLRFQLTHDFANRRLRGPCTLGRQFHRDRLPGIDGDGVKHHLARSALHVKGVEQVFHANVVGCQSGRIVA